MLVLMFNSLEEDMPEQFKEEEKKNVFFCSKNRDGWFAFGFFF